MGRDNDLQDAAAAAAAGSTSTATSASTPLAANPRREGVRDLAHDVVAGGGDEEADRCRPPPAGSAQEPPQPLPQRVRAGSALTSMPRQPERVGAARGGAPPSQVTAVARPAAAHRRHRGVAHVAVRIRESCPPAGPGRRRGGAPRSATSRAAATFGLRRRGPGGARRGRPRMCPGRAARARTSPRRAAAARGAGAAARGPRPQPDPSDRARRSCERRAHQPRVEHGMRVARGPRRSRCRSAPRGQEPLRSRAGGTGRAASSSRSRGSHQYSPGRSRCSVVTKNVAGSSISTRIGDATREVVVVAVVEGERDEPRGIAPGVDPLARARRAGPPRTPRAASPAGRGTRPAGRTGGGRPARDRPRGGRGGSRPPAACGRPARRARGQGARPCRGRRGLPGADADQHREVRVVGRELVRRDSSCAPRPWRNAVVAMTFP